MRVLRFLISGGIGLTVNLGIFRALYVLGVPYLVGSIVAFLVALFVGFVLQKYWTFEERTLKYARKQLILYSMLALCNLTVNTLVVYLFIEYAGVHYLVAQAIAAGLVATVSYFMYRLYIFAVAF